MNRHVVSLSLSAACVLAFTQNASAERQVLDYQAPQQTASNSEQGDCGEYILSSVNVTTAPVAGAAQGTVTILNIEKQTLAAKQIPAGEQGQVSVLLKSLDEGDSVENVTLKLVEVGVDGQTKVVGSTETNAAGEATFSQQLAQGSYQVAIECGTPVAAVAPVSSSSAGLAALGATGATALAVGLAVNNDGSSSSRSTLGAPQPRVEEPIAPPPPVQQSASQSGEQ
ncbi:MAG: hypothetical protein KDD69_10245 [Bdellovibrionales bacterium]|nr:hypothetical protein [Bdellovibrionales bacterium]